MTRKSFSLRLWHSGWASHHFEGERGREREGEGGEGVRERGERRGGREGERRRECGREGGRGREEREMKEGRKEGERREGKQELIGIQTETYPQQIKIYNCVTRFMKHFLSSNTSRYVLKSWSFMALSKLRTLTACREQCCS